MAEKSPESRVVRVKKLSIQDNNFSPKDMIGVDDFKELSDIFKDEPIVIEKFKLMRKIIGKKREK
jgi:hypothetical protein